MPSQLAALRWDPSREVRGKNRGHPWGKSWEDGKIMGNRYEKYGKSWKIMGNRYENHGKSRKTVCRNTGAFFTKIQ
jgi:hypothetical protein